ncbi:MAG: HD domain-containing protein [Chloroflexota bacterium]
MLNSKEDAIEMLEKLGASERLLTHAMLVSEASAMLIDVCEEFDLNVNVSLIEIGAVLHDAGKVVCKNELDQEGSNHEAAGEKLLLKHGVAPEIARICRSHARYDEMEVSLEELLIALADKLWKGKRVEQLELEVVDRIADSVGQSRWDIFPHLDDCFENIASNGDNRLARSY